MIVLSLVEPFWRFACHYHCAPLLLEAGIYGAMALMYHSRHSWVSLGYVAMMALRLVCAALEVLKYH